MSKKKWEAPAVTEEELLIDHLAAEIHETYKDEDLSDFELFERYTHEVIRRSYGNPEIFRRRFLAGFRILTDSHHR